MTTLVHIRVPVETKAKASKIFSKLGLDLSTGIKIYLAKVVEDKGIPFSMKTREGILRGFKIAHDQIEKGDYVSHKELKAQIAKKARSFK
ncbi:type II toxin-antitoxin system RelB/DinJ family antitoxin [Candidatus Peregrinibacteria bacterium]|nr:type II toxin-antitoxin system RelB/DinJ family antitoxin [Candidatus Peregrinibacteria bacterium]